MAAYMLVVVALFSRLMPHPDWFSFTAVGGALLYFGARRPLRQMWAPVLALCATDYILTVFFYNYPFHISDYLFTWAWYAGVIVLGQVLLSRNASAARLTAGVLIAPTSFFLISNFAAWAMMPQLYPRTFGGLELSFAAGLPFYRNDVLSTALVTALAFGLPVLARRFAHHSQPASA